MTRMLVRWAARFSLAVLAAAVSGCFFPAYQGFQSPVTVAPRQAEFGAELSAAAGYVVDTVDYGPHGTSLHTTELTALEVGLLGRIGIDEHLDIGLRLPPGLISMADVKCRFLSGPVSAAAGVGFFWYPRSIFTLGPFTGNVGGVAFYPVLAVGSERLYGGLRAVVLHEVDDQPGHWRFQPEFGIIDLPAPASSSRFRRLVSASAGFALLFRA